MTKLQEAYIKTGGVSDTSKMPCYSWGIPAFTCRKGKRMRDEHPNSVCGICYAFSGAYNWKMVKDAYYNRYKCWHELPDREWVNYMTTILSSKKVRKSGYFRWFDSGDIQSLSMIYQIIEIADRTPFLEHWVATREDEDIEKVLTEYIPDNLVFRLSHTYKDQLDKDISDCADRKNINQSLVVSSTSVKLLNKQFTCPSSLQDGKCLDCRACWNHKVKHVVYIEH